MGEEIKWWQSRTIWVGLLTAVFGILSGMGVLPEPMHASAIDEIVTVGLGLLTVFFRTRAVAKVAPTLPTTPA